MGPLVYLEILRPGEDLATSIVRTREGFLAGVYPYVIDELVLGLEGPTVTRAALPVTRVRCALGSAHMFYREVRHDVLKVIEGLAADTLVWSFLVHPHAGHVLPLGGGDDADRAVGTATGAVIPHVSDEAGMMRWVAHDRVLLVMDRRRR